MDLQNTVKELNCSPEGFNSKPVMQRVSKLKDKSLETIQLEEKSLKGVKRSKA
jgi:hypothetical protein